MRRSMQVMIASALCAAPSAVAYDEDVIVFSANQSWLSRIYVLDTNGAVLDYFEYEFYIFSDLEVVDGEVYAVDWIAPRVYRVDIETGALDVVIDDWSLISMYDVAWDGAHFYCDEWSLNRYDADGDWDGSASFDEAIRGSAFDENYYYTIDVDGSGACWDLADWPQITEMTEIEFAPPTPQCRGLWFDGEYFWTAERRDGQLGWIYRFERDGTIIDQWLAPAFDGYAAALVRAEPTGDMNGDGTVNVQDLLLLLDAWGPCPEPPADCPADLDGDGEVDVQDLLLVLANWG
jgi:hypothetical protein